MRQADTGRDAETIKLLLRRTTEDLGLRGRKDLERSRAS
jgi:hypothetical protein